MSVIVSDDLLPGPPMERLGFSLAGMASAGTPDQATAAAAAVLGAAEGLRVGFAALRTNRDRLVHDTGAAEPSRVRELLDRALEAERHLTDAVVLLRCFVAKAGAAHGQSDAARLRDFADELDAEFLPLMRALRADVICVIAERARGAGLDVIDPSPDFRRGFAAAPLAETESWQETAWLLADLDQAKALSASMRSAATDRTRQPAQ